MYELFCSTVLHSLTLKIILITNKQNEFIIDDVYVLNGLMT